MDAAQQTTTSAETRRRGLPPWVWLVLAIAALLVLAFGPLALLPVGLVFTVTGVTRRLTADDAQERALGTVLAVAGLALTAFTAAVLLFLVPIAVGDAEAEPAGVVEELHVDG